MNTQESPLQVKIGFKKLIAQYEQQQHAQNTLVAQRAKAVLAAEYQRCLQLGLSQSDLSRLAVIHNYRDLELIVTVFEFDLILILLRKMISMLFFHCLILIVLFVYRSFHFVSLNSDVFI